jgi:hypothetical protein
MMNLKTVFQPAPCFNSLCSLFGACGHFRHTKGLEKLSYRNMVFDFGRTLPFCALIVYPCGPSLHADPGRPMAPFPVPKLCFRLQKQLPDALRDFQRRAPVQTVMEFQDVP